MNIKDLIGYEWLFLLAVWLIYGLRVKRQIRTLSLSSRIPYVLILVLTGGMIFSHYFDVGVLNIRFVPKARSTDLAALALTSAGIAFAVWARLFLGRNWSATPGVTQEHELIRTGPYSLVRHPIYSGILLALLGTSISKGHLSAIIGTVISAIGWHVKSRVEEQFMEQQFGSEYVRYKREVKGLIPFVL